MLFVQTKCHCKQISHLIEALAVGSVLLYMSLCTRFLGYSANEMTLFLVIFLAEEKILFGLKSDENVLVQLFSHSRILNVPRKFFNFCFDFVCYSWMTLPSVMCMQMHTEF